MSFWQNKRLAKESLRTSAPVLRWNVSTSLHRPAPAVCLAIRVGLIVPSCADLEDAWVLTCCRASVGLEDVFEVPSGDLGL